MSRGTWRLFTNNCVMEQVALEEPPFTLSIFVFEIFVAVLNFDAFCTDNHFENASTSRACSANGFGRSPQEVIRKNFCEASNQKHFDAKIVISRFLGPKSQDSSMTRKQSWEPGQGERKANHKSASIVAPPSVVGTPRAKALPMTKGSNDNIPTKMSTTPWKRTVCFGHPSEF